MFHILVAYQIPKHFHDMCFWGPTAKSVRCLPFMHWAVSEPSAPEIRFHRDGWNQQVVASTISAVLFLFSPNQTKYGLCPVMPQGCNAPHQVWNATRRCRPAATSWGQRSSCGHHPGCHLRPTTCKVPAGGLGIASIENNGYTMLYGFVSSFKYGCWISIRVEMHFSWDKKLTPIRWPKTMMPVPNSAMD